MATNYKIVVQIVKVETDEETGIEIEKKMNANVVPVGEDMGKVLAAEEEGVLAMERVAYGKEVTGRLFTA